MFIIWKLLHIFLLTSQVRSISKLARFSEWDFNAVDEVSDALSDFDDKKFFGDSLNISVPSLRSNSAPTLDVKADGRTGICFSLEEV